MNAPHREYGTLSDGLLVILLQKGDHGAFREIYLRHWHPLLVMARRKLQSQEVAEELVQDLFVDLWERRQTARIDELRNYLFGAVKYKVLNEIRSRLQQSRFQQQAGASLPEADHRTEEMLAYEELSDAVRSSIALLPEKTQLIFRMNREENQSVRQIAHRLQVPERTVEYHLTQSVRALRLHLKDFVMCTLFLFGLAQ
ncbi:sigma-70 family RNA polymerase sigma factor [Larkinella soli]|uniref:sigma-70 family RNA polymerase sigma factor n=1 Tax=Larkinella soli TaxID=1770527 RepID=UPI000FFC2494|nr:sigma-70 family RNA polymerase sigma factor [Larkinella soli]